MYLFVKYVCDGATDIVPLTYVKNWKTICLDSLSENKIIDASVFWSPDGNETPTDVYLAQGKILDVENVTEKSKGKIPLSGYYKATIIKNAETKEELETILENKKIRSTLKRKGPPTDSVIATPKLKVVTSTSSSDSSCQKVSQIVPKSSSRLKTVSNKSNISKIVKLPSLFENEDQQHIDSQTDSSCSDDGVVPEKFYQKEVSILKKEYQTLKDKYKSLKLKYEKVCSLNIKLQETIVAKSQQTPSLPAKSHQSSPSSMPALVSKPDVTKTPSSLFSSNNQKPQCGSPHTNQIQPVTNPSSNGSSELYELTLNKVKQMKRVKVGEGGDSLFVKNVALILWTAEELTSSSVTGQRCHAKKDSVAKPALCTEKWQILCDLLKKRLEDEGCVGEDCKRRLSKVRGYVAEKIVTLNRVSKPTTIIRARDDNVDEHEQEHHNVPNEQEVTGEE